MMLAFDLELRHDSGNIRSHYASDCSPIQRFPTIEVDNEIGDNRSDNSFRRPSRTNPA